MAPIPKPPRFGHMKKRLYFLLLVLGLLLLAACGWAVQGLRRVATPAFGS
jgi:cytochrome b561